MLDAKKLQKGFSMRQVINIQHQGRTGNKIIQYLVAKSLQAMVPGTAISGLDIPEIDLIASHASVSDRIFSFHAGHEFSLRRIAYLLQTCPIDILNFSVFGARMDHLPSLERSRVLLSHLFQSHSDRIIADDEVLIHIRLNNLLLDQHEDYPLIPLSFYQQICDESGLNPVFIGQIEEDAYSKALKIRFPKGRFLKMSSIKNDLITISSARNVVCSVSTFSWIASWLSRSNMVVYFPVFGFLNPLQRPDIDLLPVNDKRYRFFRFPIEQWSASIEQQDNAIYGTRPMLEISSDDLIKSQLHSSSISAVHQNK